MSEAAADRRPPLARRTFLAGVAAVPVLASCGGPKNGAGASGPEASELAAAASFAAAVTALEERYGAEAGVFAVDLASQRTLEHRADQRFMMCSTFKTLAAGAVLRRSQDEPGLLDQASAVPADPGPIAENSPFSSQRLGQSATYAELCRAAIELSDNLAGNLLLDLLGGPPALTGFVRSLGDQTTRLDRKEEDLNVGKAEDLLDTTTPRAIATTYQKLVLGDALAAPQRQQLADWLIGATTGTKCIRAGLPSDWKTGDKTGTGAQGDRNDVAVAWPAGGKAPLVLAVLTRTPPPKPRQDQLLAEVASAARTALGL
ncbi:MAG: class A beta-lactamase [Segniliparus sp.]|uniref:class A beta-lactamase n=1 Tax=Segniliparus sp. TaxID=2804064 RepID=UPI003F4005AA